MAAVNPVPGGQVGGSALAGLAATPTAASAATDRSAPIPRLMKTHPSIASSSVFDSFDRGADATPARVSEQRGQHLVDLRAGPGLSASAERATPGVSGKRLGRNGTAPYWSTGLLR